MLEKSMTKSAKCSGGGPFLCSTHSAGLCAFELSGAPAAHWPQRVFAPFAEEFASPRM